MGPLKSTATIIATLFCAQSAWSDITLKLVDGDSKPIAGVSCSQIGGAAAVSDASGNLTLSSTATLIAPQRANGAISLSRIPLAAGEKASVEVIDTKGRRVLQRLIGAGDRIELPARGNAVYFARITAHGRSVSGRVADLGHGLAFEGVAPEAPVSSARTALAKSAAADFGIVCSKAGMPSQVYRVKDGATTIDFSKVTLVPLYDGGTKLEPENIIETPKAIITRWNDRARDRHAREDQYHAYDHYLAHYWENRTAIIQITDSVAKGGTKIRVDQWTQWPLDPKAREFRAF